jgi:hypothetical protein
MALPHVKDNGWTMWTPFLILSLLLGLAALVWSFTIDLSGWAELSALGPFFLWLTAVSLAVLGVLWELRSSLRWITIASIIIFCGAMQFGIMGVRGRLPFAFMPAILLLIAGTALSGRTLPGWTPRVMPWLALAAIAFAGGGEIANAHQRRAMEQRIQALGAQNDHDDLTLRGRERAAWLLEQEFSTIEHYRSADFLATGIYTGYFNGGEYRWDASKNRLIVTRALTVVPQAAIGDGVLDCNAQGCRITWEIDVDQLHWGDRALRKRIDDWVAELQFKKIEKERY